MSRSSLLRHPLARIFTADKHVDSRLLNLLGIQVLRQVSARMLLRLRYLFRRQARQVAGFTQLTGDGLLVLHDFLPPEKFRQLRDECMAALDDVALPKSDLQHGPTVVRRIHLQKYGDLLPLANAATSSPDLLDLLAAAEGKALEAGRVHRVVERVFHGRLDQHDPENDLHIDTFHSTHKAWLYLDDVGAEQGPLAVVPGSHRLDGNLLGHTYRYFRDFGKSARSPSRRVAKSELDQRKLREVAMVVPANTLVIANTGGYHRRLRGTEGAMRTALHVSARSQPFLYWVNAAGKSDY